MLNMLNHYIIQESFIIKEIQEFEISKYTKILLKDQHKKGIFKENNNMSKLC